MNSSMVARSLKEGSTYLPNWRLSSRIGLAVLIGILAVLMIIIQPAGGLLNEGQPRPIHSRKTIKVENCPDILSSRDVRIVDGILVGTWPPPAPDPCQPSTVRSPCPFGGS